jgi:hypothetical protein
MSRNEFGTARFTGATTGETRADGATTGETERDLEQNSKLVVKNNIWVYLFLQVGAPRDPAHQLPPRALRSPPFLHVRCAFFLLVLAAGWPVAAGPSSWLPLLFFLFFFFGFGLACLDGCFPAVAPPAAFSSPTPALPRRCGVAALLPVPRWPWP